MGPELRDKAIRSRKRRLAWVLALLAPLVLAPVWLLLLGGIQTAPLIGTQIGLIAALLIVTCTYTDLRYRKVPNWATYSAFLWAIIINGSASALGLVPHPAETEVVATTSVWIQFLFQGTVGLTSCLCGAGVCFFIMIFIYELAGGGAGDVKLVTALGGLLGFERGLQALVYSYIAAGVVIVCWSIWTVGPIYLFKALARKIGSFFLPQWIACPSAEQEQFLKRPIPLSLFFALGTIPILLGLDMLW